MVRFRDGSLVGNRICCECFLGNFSVITSLLADVIALPVSSQDDFMGKCLGSVLQGRVRPVAGPKWLLPSSFPFGFDGGIWQVT